MKRAAFFLAMTAAFSTAQAKDTELNLYSARHYQTDEALYADFTKQTGIKINRIEGKENELLERLKNEGASSPADVFITVDASRLAKADELGLFAPVKSKAIESRVPANLRADTWLAFSIRASTNCSAVRSRRVTMATRLAPLALIASAALVTFCGR